MVVGNSNNVCAGQTVDKLAKSLVVGDNNTLNGNRNSVLVSGNSNSANCTSSLVAGFNNDIAGVGGNVAVNSCMIGANNNADTTHAYAIGYNGTITGDYGMSLGYSNTVSGSYGHAVGVGLTVNQSNAVAVGRYNGSMSSGDVFVVGTGSSTSPITALKATSDGSVTLGNANSGKVLLARAQGDISMGAYSN